MRNVVFIFLVLSLLSLQNILGMDTAEQLKREAEILSIHLMMYTDPDRACDEARAFVSDVSGDEIQRMIDTSQVKYKKYKHCDRYSVALPNGDSVWANYFTSGPIEGQYICTHATISKRTNSRSLLALDDTMFDTLRNRYQQQTLKK